MCEIDQFRTVVLQSLHANEAEIRELLAYNANHFEADATIPAFPLQDETHVNAWDRYASDVRIAGTVAVLSNYFPQFCFPIAHGMSETPEYRAATRRGEFRNLRGVCKLSFRAPDQISLLLHPTPAGRVPVLIAADRADFETLVRAFSRRNEPGAVPPSMGACVIGGYNNWHRVQTLRDDFLAAGADAASWSARFAEIKQSKELYQDSFIILSRGDYSGVAAKQLGIDSERWRDTSLAIRLEHECVHYFTRRVFRSMKNSVLDELIADYIGITMATGRFSSDWALKFLGLDEIPSYREGGRLQNYRGNPPLSEGAFRILQELVYRAVLTLERFDTQLSPRWRENTRVAAIFTLTALTVEELASPNSLENLTSRFHEYLKKYSPDTADCALA
jgi:hypothetical protein